MGTTHALAGAFLGAAVALAAPEFATAAFVAAVAGSVAPDFDIYRGHRRALHYPVYGWLAAVPAVALAGVAPGTWTVAPAVFLVAAAAHAAMDVFGGGLELRPWEAGSEHAVFSHYHGRWLAPRRLVPYDGSPQDLALAGAFAIPPAATLPTPVPALVGVVLAVSVAYVALRRRLARLWEVIADGVPEPVEPYVPERFYD